MDAKQLEMLRRVAPYEAPIALVANPINANAKT
jgi:hypothetical protein